MSTSKTGWQPTFAVIEVTNRCNLRCPHCASASGCARADEMTLAEMQGVMRRLAELGGQTVTLLGSDFVEDNLRRRSLREIWEDERSFSRFRGKPAQLTGACAKCPKAGACKAGCSAAALSTTGTLTENAFCVRQVEMRQILSDMLDD